MRHRNYLTRLSLAAMLMSSVYLVACGGSGEGETSAQEGFTETAESLAREGETSAHETSAQEASTEMAERLSTYTWSKVADQGQTFTLASWTWVRYGSGKNWVYKRVSGTVSCTNEFFGNPAPGVRKACYAIVATPDPAPPPPPAPTGTAALSWTASTDANVTGYRVYYGTAPGAHSQPRGSGLTTGNATSRTVSGLNPGTLYYFAVTAVDSQGNESAYSNEVSKVLP